MWAADPDDTKAWAEEKAILSDVTKSDPPKEQRPILP